MPHGVMRRGTWARMKPTEHSLYIGLPHESERYCTRELVRSDDQMRQLTGVSRRALRDARIRLQECGLIRYYFQPGCSCRYVICDPDTGNPYPGDPRHPIPYVPKATRPKGQDCPPNTGAKAAEPTPRRIPQRVSGKSLGLPPFRFSPLPRDSLTARESPARRWSEHLHLYCR